MRVLLALLLFLGACRKPAREETPPEDELWLGRGAFERSQVTAYGLRAQAGLVVPDLRVASVELVELRQAVEVCRVRPCRVASANAQLARRH